MKKKKWIFVPVIMAICALAAVYMLNYYNNDKTPVIHEFESEHVAAKTNSTDFRYFVISNPPSELSELKDTIEDYLNLYVQEKGKENINTGCEHYYWRFMRESKKVNYPPLRLTS